MMRIDPTAVPQATRILPLCRGAPGGEVSLERFDIGQNSTRLFDVAFSFGGQRHTAGRAIEQPDAQSLLEPCNRFRDGRRRQTDIVGRGGKAASLGEFPKSSPPFHLKAS